MNSTIVSDLMAEHVNYGGVAATRKQVYDDIQLRFPNNPRTGIGSADWTAFSRPALTPQEARVLIPWGIVCTGCSTDLRIRASHPIESMCHPCWMEYFPRKAGKAARS